MASRRPRRQSDNVSPLAARLGLAGAIAFGASDTLLAFDRFLQPITGVHFPILVLYWLGQWGIAASAALGARAEVSARRASISRRPQHALMPLTRPLT